MKRQNYKSILVKAKKDKWELVKQKYNNPNICIGDCKTCQHPRWCVFDGDKYELELKLSEIVHDRKLLEEGIPSLTKRENVIFLNKTRKEEKKLKEDYKNLKEKRILKI